LRIPNLITDTFPGSKNRPDVSKDIEIWLVEV